MTAMEPWLVFPDPPPAELVQTLELAGHAWKAVADEVAVNRMDDVTWRGALVVLGDAPEAGLAVCRALRKRDVPVEPVLLLVRGSGLADLELRDDVMTVALKRTPAARISSSSTTAPPSVRGSPRSSSASPAPSTWQPSPPPARSSSRALASPQTTWA